MFLSTTDTIITDGFLLIPTLFFALGCWVVTFIIRKVVETAYPKIKGTPPYETKLQSWWHEVILFAAPALVGVGGALSLKNVEMVIPKMFSSWQGAILYGLVIGFFCSLIYKAFKKMFFSKLGVKDEKELPKATVPKPPGDEKEEGGELVLRSGDGGEELEDDPSNPS
jgi:hypothetical protein